MQPEPEYLPGNPLLVNYAGLFDYLTQDQLRCFYGLGSCCFHPITEAMRPVGPSARYEKNSAFPHTVHLAANSMFPVANPGRPQLVPGDRPEVEVFGANLKGPQLFGNLLSVVHKLGAAGAKGRRYGGKGLRRI